jgi:hypothetical protein
MAAMPLLNRQPESPYVHGLLIVLALILLATVLRYFHFFVHEVIGLR